MRLTLPLVALLLVAASQSAAQAQWPPYGCPAPLVRQAPDACGPGYYDVNAYGQVFGPNYWLLPPGGPFNGMIFARQATGYGGGGGGPGGILCFPTHPYARSPRDFFMME
jgi:hypothetical protein